MDHRLDHGWDDDEIDLADAADFTLGALTLSPSTREVRWAGGGEIVQPRVMQALVCLAQADGAVVSRDELVRRCWGGRIVGEDAINRCIAKARQLAEAAGGAPAFVIETIPRVGYRLRRNGAVAAPAKPRRAPSRAWLLAGAAACVPAIALGAWLAWKPAPAARDAAPPMRSVAVLPIQNLTGDPALEPAVDRLTEDITYVVGRTGYISVPPRTATFALKGRSVDDRALGKSLGVRNLVIGSLRKEGTGYRVSYQMVDTATGQVVDTQDLGAARPDGALPEPQLAMAVNEQISDAIDHRWTAAELAKPANDHDPENVMARLHHMNDWGAAQPSVAETQRLITTAASEIKPDSPLAAEFGTMACWYYLEMIEGGYAASPAQRDAWARLALDYGHQATVARPDATGAHGCRAEVFGQLGQWDAGQSEAQYVIDTYPLATSPYEARGEAEMAHGRFGEALRDFAEVGERGGEGASSSIGVARLFLGQDAAAIETLQARTSVEPTDAGAYFFLSAAYELAGDHREAVASADAYRRLSKDSSAWRTLELSREPAYVGPARAIRTALHGAGLDEPAAPRA